MQTSRGVDAPNDTTYVAWIGETGYETLEAAVNAAPANQKTTITLGEGKYTLYNKGAQTKGKSFIFVGQGTGKTEWGIGATVPDPSKFGTEYNGDYSFDGAGSVTFKDMTLQSGTVDYLGFIRADDTIVENCVINGKTFYWGYKTATFKNTTFNCPSSDYALWTYSSPTMTFDTCTFNSSGKVINVYTDYGAGKNDITVNFKDCTVNNTGSNKTALNINDKNMGSYKYILNISGTNTVTGINPEDLTCSKLFGFGGHLKAAFNGTNSGKTDVYIDGTKVWTAGKMVSHEIDCTNDKYTEGYKDNAYTITEGDWTDQADGTQQRTVTKVCKYCGWKTETTETRTPYTVSYDLQGGTPAEGVDYSDYTFYLEDDEWEVYAAKKDPTREGYIFTSWNTEADGSGEECWWGTELFLRWSIKLYAQWEKAYTVTYTDGVADAEIFADQVTTDLTAGSKTPAFNGTPTREGYTFIGWAPEVAETVSEDVTYIAQWEKVETPKTDDKKDPVDPGKDDPKTDDPKDKIDSGKDTPKTDDKTTVDKTTTKTDSKTPADKNNTKPGKTTPKTSDMGSVTLWFALAGAAVVAAAGTTVYRRKNR